MSESDETVKREREQSEKAINQKVDRAFKNKSNISNSRKKTNMQIQVWSFPTKEKQIFFKPILQCWKHTNTYAKAEMVVARLGWL